MLVLAASRLAAPPAVRETLTAAGCLPLPRPAGAQYGPVGSAIVVNWEPAPGADSYTVYHDDHSDPSCRVDLAGRATFCDQVAVDVLVTRFVHTNPEAGDNSYWVSACNRWHCTTVEGDDPAEPVVEPPPPAARSPEAGSDEECSARWARRPELRFAQAIEMCGGDVEVLRADHVEACANSDPADAGLEWRTYADFARDNEIEGRARAGEARTAGDEDRAAYFELLAERYASEAEHTGNRAAEAAAAETDRRERIIAERGVASWAEACRQMTDEMWSLDLPGLAEAGVDLAAHFGELANVVCGGYS